MPASRAAATTATRDEDRAEAAVGDPGHRERCERRQAEPEPDQRGGRRQAPRRHQQRPEHAGGRDLTGPRERPDGEHQRAQQPAGRRDQQRQRIKADGHPDRRQPRSDPGEQPGGEIAERQPGRDADPGQHQHLEQIHAEDQAAARAEALQRGDGRGLAGKEVLDRERDADAADQQRGQGGHGQIAREAIGEPGDLRLHVARAARPPVGIGMAAPKLGDQRRGVAAGGQREAVVVADERSGQDDLGTRQIGHGDHDARPDRLEADELVRLACDHGAHGEGRLADPDLLADADAQTAQHARVDHGAAVGERAGEVERRLQADRAVERVGAVHGLQADHDAAAFGPERHRVGAHDLGAARRGRHQPSQHVVRDWQIVGFEADVAAEQRGGIAFDRVDHAGIGHPDGRNRSHAQRQAGEEHGEALEAAAQLAPGQAPRQRELVHATSAPDTARGRWPAATG